MAERLIFTSGNKRPMKRGLLSEYFTGAGTKILSYVDATRGSNQHEVGDHDNGRALMKVLGEQERKKDNRFEALYLWLYDEQETISESGFLSWYDTRANQSHRSPEWRLYYQTNAVTESMTEGDRLFVARQPDDLVFFIVVPANSVIANQLIWLFGLDLQNVLDFEARTINENDDSILDFTTRFLLDELGIEYEDPNANSLDAIIERFGFNFPPTREFSDLARLTLPEVNALDDPDMALLTWLDHEEAMFRRLENKIVARDIEIGWVQDGKTDVDAFIKYSLGVHNRRKSRMGRSFENHLTAIFDAFSIKYDAQVTTENGKKPDFIFPGKEEYFDETFDISALTMLAAKSTCKERWSQILPEAERIERKHLVTLEPAISQSQTQTMSAANVQLVVPGKISESYAPEQREWLWSMSDFIGHVKGQQIL